ncbi:hypothetical protein ACAG96_07905 [Candidatus Izemoplasma sp. B36]|uniref:hypothetical protein n=1 Tax=Candidatus Izemoplasma sp. B36 TaxID=3242468 RepID=UPI003556864A
MNKIYECIYNNKTKKIIVILAFITLLTYTLMLTNIFGVVSEFDRIYMLDLSIFYNGEEFINNFSTIAAQQVYYYQVIHFIDYVFILSFYPLLTIIIAKLIKKQYYFLFIIPLFSMIFDFIENMIIDLHMHYNFSKTMGTISGVSTLLKFNFIFISIILLIIILVRKFKENGNIKISDN